MAFTDNEVINKLSNHYGAIGGIAKSFGFAENPDNITNAILPCVMFYIPRFEHFQLAHHNRWTTKMYVRAILFVAPRETQGGRLKFLENQAIPFGDLVRRKFEQEAVITDLLTIGSGGTTQAWLESGQYGAGQRELVHNGIEYIGWTFDHQITNTV